MARAVLLQATIMLAATNGRCRIVLTGEPGAGKTTAADLFRREIGERVVVVPEAATLLFMGGFPRVMEAHAPRAAQAAIYHLQRNLEDVHAAVRTDAATLPTTRNSLAQRSGSSEQTI